MDDLQRLDAWLAANRPGFHGSLAAGAKPAALKALAKSLGFAVPPPLAKLLTWRDGEKDGADEGRFQHNWSLMSSKAIAGAHRVLTDLEKGGEFELADWWDAAWVPFLENGGGDHVCVDVKGSFKGQPGQVLEFFHDEPWRKVLYPSLDAWLSVFVATLENGAWELDDEHGFFEVEDKALRAAMKKTCKGYPKKKEARERDPAPAPAPAGAFVEKGTVDRKAAERYVKAWGRAVSEKLKPEPGEPYRIRSGKYWFDHDPERGVLVIRMGGVFYKSRFVDDVFHEQLALDQKLVAKKKARLELVAMADPNNDENDVAIIVRRDLTDGGLSDEKVVEFLRETSRARSSYWERRTLAFFWDLDKLRTKRKRKKK